VRYVSTDNENNHYTLEVTEKINGTRVVYAPRGGDSFVLTIELYNNGNYAVSLTCPGNVHNLSGATLALQFLINDVPLSITIENGNMAVVSGTIVSDDGETGITANEPKTLTPVIDKAN
jgi:hypothetical protein